MQSTILSSIVSTESLKQAENLEKPSFQIAISSSYTVDPLIPYLETVLESSGLDSQITLAPYGQVIETLINPLSAFGQNPQGLNICLFRFGDWKGDDKDDQRSTRLHIFVKAVEEFAKQTAGSLLICLGPEPDPDRDYYQLESTLDQLKKLEGVALVRLTDWFSNYTVDDIFDPVSDRLAHIPYSEAAFATLALSLNRVANSMISKPRKVIAVDCDFTLWDGACGDLTPEELSINPRHLALHDFLKLKYEEGFALALCSRNDPESVEKVFSALESNWSLKREHFISAQINWKPKWENLKTIAQGLNVNVDTLILIDDDPFVCAQTESHLPEVAVINIPVDGDATLLYHRPEFDRFFLTREDTLRNASYKADKARRLLQKSSLTAEALNIRLKTQISVHISRPAEYRRIEQLYRKTNQFTLASMRPEDIIRDIDHGASSWSVTLDDSFGEYGVVAAALTSIENQTLHINAMAMSCRVLHRGVETALLSRLREAAISERCNKISARLFVNERNHLARSFFTDAAEKIEHRESDETYKIALI